MPQNDKYKKEREQLFESLLTHAKRKGYIRADTIIRRFEKFNLSEPDKEDLISRFEEQDIIIVYPEPGDNQEDKKDDLEFETKELYVPKTESSMPVDAQFDSVKLYLKEIHAFPSLTHQETLALVRQIMEGDNEAREFLIKCNLKLAYVIASKYESSNIPLLDLVQQANIGLMSAVDHYNPNRGTKFSSYAVFWIKQSIFRYIEMHSRSIRLPGYIHSEIKKIRELQEENYRTHQRYLTDDEVATALNKTISRVKYLSTLENGIISLDDKPDEDMDKTYLEMITLDDESQNPFNEVNNADLEKNILCFLEKLPEREQLIIRMRYGIYNGNPMSLEEIGTEMNLSRERIRQLESKALGRLRKMKGITRLYDYLHR